MLFRVGSCVVDESETFHRHVSSPARYGGHVERWRHALAIGFGIIGAIVAVLSGGDPAALSLALGGGLSTGLGYWVGALLNRRRDSR